MIAYRPCIRELVLKSPLSVKRSLYSGDGSILRETRSLAVKRWIKGKDVAAVRLIPRGVVRRALAIEPHGLGAPGPKLAVRHYVTAEKPLALALADERRRNEARKSGGL
jgi:hypothetical protein